MTDANVKRSSEDLDKDLKELIDFEKKFALVKPLYQLIVPCLPSVKRLEK